MEPKEPRHHPLDRKNDALKEAAVMLLGGLLVGLLLVLAAACLLFRDASGKIDAAGADMLYKLFLVYAGGLTTGLTGKTGFYMLGSAKEDAALASTNPNPAAK